MASGDVSTWSRKCMNEDYPEGLKINTSYY